MTMQLHDYQRRASEWLERHPRAILAIEMGLGKTATVLDYINRLRPATCLIVAPKRVAETVWMQEADKWDLTEVHDKMVIVKGTKDRRMKLLSDTSRPYKVIGRDNVADCKRMSFDLVVLDELTSFKSVTSQRSKAIASVRSPRVIGLTGTFLANGAIDIYGQAQAVGLAGLLGRNFFSWRASYFYDALAGSGLMFHKWKPAATLQCILRPLQDHIFTLLAADYLDLPPVSEHEHRVTLSDGERTAYDSAEAFLGADFGSGVVESVDEAAKFAKLQTLCNGFMYRDDGSVVSTWTTTKFDQVAEFCARAYGEGEQVLLFYAYRYEAECLTAKLKAAGVPVCNVKDSGALDSWHRREAGVMLAHPASAGHGLNLQHEGRLIVWSSVTYNFEHFAQANARLARQGQTLPVEIHYFTATGTIEEAQRRALSKKAKEQGTFEMLTRV